MTRETVTVDILKGIIQERISNSDELDGDCREVIVNSVYKHEPDETGSNWSVHSVQNATGCKEVVNIIIAEFKQKYNLEENNN